MKHSIHNLRNEIKIIDEKIIALLQERISLSNQIGSVKKQRGIKIKDREQEKKVIAHIEAVPHDPLYTQDIKKLYSSIIRICRKSQKSEK